MSNIEQGITNDEVRRQKRISSAEQEISNGEVSEDDRRYERDGSRCGFVAE